ncbi:hypothetical protein GYMLUDRAFT_33049 [Collybiopsis luxurians FD-317 M1]|nr:hypothetical protein GYMLUDRAFT_33049 [Collybiopsis luxurians FD-317 M1]
MTCTSAWTLSSKNSKAILVFIITLLAFVTESQLTQFVQTTYGYRKPYFIFWIVHSSFIISLPLHLLCLSITTDHSLSSLWNGLLSAVSLHLNGDVNSFPTSKCLALASKLTLAVTWPALLWFFALEMSSVTDVTAIWNTNAFFAYLLSVKFGSNSKMETRKLSAVIIATLGVLAVVYGGSTVSSESPSTASLPKASVLLGDSLTLLASIGYAAYQVFYKMHAALPSDPEFDPEYRPLTASDESESRPIRQQDLAQNPPFGLYSNFWTFTIGAIEPFALPGDISITGTIAGIALTGAIFNAGFMILLALWGPVITSVGGLLTIVLVFFSDVLLGATETLTLWGIAGSATIVVAFGVLAYDMLQSE